MSVARLSNATRAAASKPGGSAMNSYSVTRFSHATGASVPIPGGAGMFSQFLSNPARSAVMNPQLRQFTVQPGQAGHSAETIKENAFNGTASAKPLMTFKEKHLFFMTASSLGMGCYIASTFVHLSEELERETEYQASKSADLVAREVNKETEQAVREHAAFCDMIKIAVEEAESDNALRLELLRVIDRSLTDEQTLQMFLHSAYDTTMEKKHQMLLHSAYETVMEKNRKQFHG